MLQLASYMNEVKIQIFEFHEYGQIPISALTVCHEYVYEQETHINDENLSLLRAQPMAMQYQLSIND